MNEMKTITPEQFKVLKEQWEGKSKDMDYNQLSAMSVVINAATSIVVSAVETEVEQEQECVKAADQFLKRLFEQMADSLVKKE